MFVTKMNLFAVRLCHPLTSCILKSIAASCSVHSVPIQRRFCSRYPDVGVEKANEDENFADFEETSHADEFLRNIDFPSIVGDDEEKKKALELLILKLSLALQTEKLVAPKRLTSEEWCKLLDQPSTLKRYRFLKYLYTKEKIKESKLLLKNEKREFRERRDEKIRNEIDGKPKTSSSPVVYSLKDNTLFFRIYPGEMKKLYNFNAVVSTMFGLDCIIDCSYEEYMTDSECIACARQILYLWSTNRTVLKPFNLKFCNMNPNGKIIDALRKILHSMGEEGSIIDITEKHYLDFYPAEKLIYLSPHSIYDMEEYEPEAVYIIGAFVDEKTCQPISLAKAKRDGLRVMRFPLDKYLNWAQGSKLLPINQCASILNDIKDRTCWQYALRHVAVRKQRFQFLDCDLKPKKRNGRMDAIYVRERACKDLFRDLQVKRVWSKKTENTSLTSENITTTSDTAG